MSGWKVSPRAGAVLSAWAWGPCHCWWWYGSQWAWYCCPGAGWRGPGEQLRPYNKFKTKLVLLLGSVYPGGSRGPEEIMSLSQPLSLKSWSSARSSTTVTRPTWCSGLCPDYCQLPQQPEGRKETRGQFYLDLSSLQTYHLSLLKALKIQIVRESFWRAETMQRKWLGSCHIIERKHCPNMSS